MPTGPVYTKRAKKAAKMFAEQIKEGRIPQKKEILLAAGYSPLVAQSPQGVIGKASFQELLDRYLPEEFLLDKHKDLIATASEKTALAATKLGYQLRGLGESRHTTTHLHAHAIGWLDPATTSPASPPKTVQDINATEKPSE